MGALQLAQASEPQEFFSLHLRNTGIAGTHLQTWLIMWVLEFGTWIPMLIHQAHNQLASPLDFFTSKSSLI